MNLISDIRFLPIREKRRSHVGFVNFTYMGSMAIKDVAVHRRLGDLGFRLVYPEVETNVEGEKRSVVFPINKETQERIDNEVNEFLKTVKYKGEL